MTNRRLKVFLNEKKLFNKSTKRSDSFFVCLRELFVPKFRNCGILVIIELWIEDNVFWRDLW